MHAETDTARRRRPLLRMAIAAVMAAPLGYVVGWLMADYGPDLGSIGGVEGVRWADGLAVVLALVLGVASLITLAASLSTKRTAKLLGLDDEAGPDEVRSVRRQGLVCLMSAGILVLPALLPALGMNALTAMALVAVLLVVHTMLNIDLWRSSDELIRAVTVEAGAVVFWMGQGLLFLWAAAERLGVAPGLSAWDIYVVLMGLYLVTAAVVTARRGLA